MKDLAESRTILRMVFSRKLDRSVLRLSQKRYASRVVDRFGIEDAKVHHNPMDLIINWFDGLEDVDVPFEQLDY